MHFLLELHILLAHSELEINSQAKNETVGFLYPGQLFFFLNQMQECIYILLIFIDCLPYDAKPYEKHKIEGFTSALKEPVLQ